jgi:hypothetical protein
VLVEFDCEPVVAIGTESTEVESEDGILVVLNATGLMILLVILVCALVDCVGEVDCTNERIDAIRVCIHGYSVSSSDTFFDAPHI